MHQDTGSEVTAWDRRGRVKASGFIESGRTELGAALHAVSEVKGERAGLVTDVTGYFSQLKRTSKRI